jgi:hypothetical protein
MKSLASLLGLLVLTGPLAGQSWIYRVELTGAQEVPANASPGIGTATVRIDIASRVFTVFGSYSNMMSPVTLAHIHGPAHRGANAGVAVALSTTGRTSGTFSGSGVLTTAELHAIVDGSAYLNVHTEMFVGGEIRGQIDSVPRSGSPNAAGLAISGSASPGGTLQIGCPPSINTAFVLIGLALPAGQTLPFPAFLACASPTNLGIDLVIPPLSVTGGSATLPIPAGVGAFEIGIQCALVPPSSSCVELSEANRIAIRP